MTRFEEGQIERVSRGNHNMDYLFYKIEQITKRKKITVLQWLDEFESDSEITRKLDEIDNDGRLIDYKFNDYMY